jgi:tetratricopeptide (TPR) repeat protein
MSTPAEQRFEAAQLYEEAVRRRAEGNVTGAFARYRRVLETAEALGDRAWKAELLVELGRMYQEAFEILEARRWYLDALALFRELGNEAGAGRTLLSLAQVEQLAGGMTRSEELFREALEPLRRAGDAPGEGLALVGLGQLLWEMRRVEEGGREVVAGLRLLREAGPADAEAVLSQIRNARARVGAVRYRALVGSLSADPALVALLT